MILTCNSCDKKFVVPDSAIGVSGRLVQCSSCGNKWKQFPVKQQTKPIKSEIEEKPQTKTIVSKKITKVKKKQFKKKKTGPDLYSPEYLAKKHGIRLSQEKTITKKLLKKSSNISLGFYNSLLVFFVVIVFLIRMLHFLEKIITDKFPFLEVYINYLFESLRNIQLIIQNLFLGF